jgi:hypothetical protein
LQLTSWHISNFPPYFFDGTSGGNALYNIDHARAERIWNLHKNFFNQFDVIVTSDTAPLARIFLQNNFQKHLVIWISDRFDYHDKATASGSFPDSEWYSLFRAARKKNNVTMIANCQFEHLYAKSKGVDTGSLVIEPCCARMKRQEHSAFPVQLDKRRSFFLPPYHNETKFMNLKKHCATFGIPCYQSTYNGPELQDFKAIIHLPYSWSTLALFENMQFGIPYCIPSKKFFKKLLQMPNYWHQDQNFFDKKENFLASEWYSKEHQPLFIYFDSWEDLRQKTKTFDFAAHRLKIQKFAEKQKQTMLTRWKEVFDRAT